MWETVIEFGSWTKTLFSDYVYVTDSNLESTLFLHTVCICAV